MTIPDPRDGGLPYWNDLSRAQREEIIEPLWRNGMSALAITVAAFRGATRNMIIGAIARSAFRRAERKNVSKLAAASKRGMVRFNMTKPKRKTVNPKRPKAAPDGPPVLRPDAPPSDAIDLINERRPPFPGISPIGIMELPERNAKRCHYPVVGGYCGAPSGEHPYCRAHWPYMYSPEVVARLVAAEPRPAD